MSKANETGKEGEELAARFLVEKGFELLERNWRCFKLELDIIAREKDQIVVVEVKTRSTAVFGDPFEFLGRKQQNRIIRAAHEYILEKGIDADVRFDVVAITGTKEQPELVHLRDAFYPGL